jgi:hypothetical protein
MSENVIVFLDENDNLSNLPLDSVFGVKSKCFMYVVKFLVSEHTGEHSFCLKICKFEEEDDNEEDDEELLSWFSVPVICTDILESVLQLLLTLPDLFAKYYKNYLNDKSSVNFQIHELHFFYLS